MHAHTSRLLVTQLDPCNCRAAHSAQLTCDSLCRAPSSIAHTADSSMVTYEPAVEFDGWYMYMATKGHPVPDPTAYQLDVSVDGSTWEQIARAEHRSTPQERDVQVRDSLVSLRHMWPYYLLIAGQTLAGLSLVLVPLLLCFVSGETAVRWQDAPVQILGVCFIVDGFLTCVALAFLFADNGSLPFGPFQHTYLTLGLQAALEMVLWPGPLAFTQAHSYEKAVLWGLLQTILRLATGYHSTVGPVHIVVGVPLIYFRWKWRREAQHSVQGDKQLFDKAWACIQEEADAQAGVAALKTFEEQKLVTSGILQEAIGAEQTVHASVFEERRTSHRPDATDLEVGNTPMSSPGRAGAERESRIQLFLEHISPVLSMAISKLFEENNRLKRPLASLDQLYCQAVVMEPIFRLHVQRLAMSSRGHFYVGSSHAGDPPELKLMSEIAQDEAELSRVCWPAIKHVDHALQKVSVCYHGNVARLRVLRQRIIFNSLSDICRCLDTIAQSPDLEIVRFHNSFDPDSDAHRTAGYRHVMVVLRVVTDATTAFGLSGHCCELQLSHQRMARLITPEQHARYLKYNRVVVPFEKTGRKKAFFHANFQVFMRGKGNHDDAQHSAEVSRTQSVPHQNVLPESVSFDLGALDLAGVDMRAKMTDRVVDVLRCLCQLEGGMLDSTLKHQTKLGVDTADATTVLFVLPFGAILKWPFAVITFLAGLFFGFFYWSWLADLHTGRYETRHVRFRALETRAPLDKDAGVGATISLFERNMCKIASERLESKVSDNSVFISLAKPTVLAGWSMTSALEAASQGADPVRFDLSFADTKRYSLSDCLLENTWSTAEQIQTMSAADQRSRVISELSKVPGDLCAEEDIHAVSRCQELGDDDLVRHCIPAHSLREDDWVAVSASQCRFEPNGVDCLPRPGSIFTYVSTERGFTHTFDLRPPWFVELGVVHTSLPVVVGCPVTALFGFLGYEWPARIGLVSIMFTPGVLEIITATLLATPQRTASVNIQPWDSFYWWILGFTSMLIGSGPLWPAQHEKRFVHLMGLWFVVTFPALNVHYNYILKEPGVKVPNSSAFLFCVWLVYLVSRQLVLLKSKRDVASDLRRYDDEWNAISNHVEQATAIRDLEDMTSRFSSRARPVQRMSPVHPMQRTPDSSDMLTFLPQNLQNSQSQSIFSRMVMTRQGALRDAPNSPTSSLCNSLDTLYIQAYLLEPIFNHIVKQIAVAAQGTFFDTTLQNSSQRGSFVAAEEWESTRMAIKSVDRSIEKLTRCYQGNPAFLVDVCRACVVFDSMQDLYKAMRVIADDVQLQIVRVKNRLTHNYDRMESAGYRDVLVNLCISNALTQKLGLTLHICELQLSLKRFMILKTGDGHKRYVAYRNKRSE